MGTRAIVRLFEKMDDVTENSVVVFTQYDGYPSYFGKKIAEFASAMTITNGLGGDSTNVANGAACFAAQLVCVLKTKPGNIYLYAAYDDWSWLDYTYDLVIEAGKPVLIKAYEVVSGENESEEKLVFSGTCADFLAQLS